jgi:rhodanese-related sulfurtransferase
VPMSKLIAAAELYKLTKRGEAVQLIDVRSASEFASGHVPGAINIPMEQVESRLADVAKNGQVILICQAGKRAATTAGWICDRRDVTVLEGGTDAWKNAALPVVSCAPCRWSLERQVRFGAGLIALTGSLLALFVSRNWLILPLFVGGGLTMAGLTGFCPMGIALAKMPWNQASKYTSQGNSHAGSCCS